MPQCLTEAKRLAWKIDGLGPDPHNHLVIFRDQKGGKVVHEVLRPGGVVKIPLFASRESFVAYAVAAGENLRHEFSRKYEAAKQAWTFVLNVKVQYKVSDPRQVALGLLNGDPLLDLEKEVASVFGATARLMPLEILQQEGKTLTGLLREGERADSQGEVRTNFDRLASFAKELGLLLQGLDVTRAMDEATSDVDRLELGNLRSVRKDRSNQEAEREKERESHETVSLRDQLKVEREVAEARGRQTLEGLTRLQRVLDTVAEEGSRAISQSVNDIRSFRALHDALSEVQAIQASLAGMSGGQGSAGALSGDSSPAAGQGFERRLGTSADPLDRLLGEALQHLAPLSGNPKDRRRILVSTLHLIAEAGLGRECDDDFLSAWSEELQSKVFPVRASLGEEHASFFDRLMDVDELRQQFA